MRIGIDARRLLQESDPTWPYYLYSLITALQEIDRENEYTLLFNYFRKKYSDLMKLYAFNSNFRTKSVRIPHKIFEHLFENMHLPVETLLGRTDVFHGPVYACLNNKQGKSVVTIPDLIFLRTPEHVDMGWVEFARKNTEYSIKKADAIITISEFSKSEILDVYKIPEDRIRVIYLGIGKEYYPRTQGIDRLKIKHGITGKYILYVGAIEPRKNLVTLIHSFNNLKRTIRDKYKLVLTGVRRYGSEDVLKKVEDLQLQNDVIFTGRVPREDLPYLYSGAGLFVFPSLNEGFGLPPLEAMACGTPVIASNLTSIPEVVGDAAVLVDSRNADAITEAIETTLSDDLLRDRLRHKGLKRAASFSWERTARETLALYKEVG